MTILFADIVGSTSLGEQIDPEDLAEIVNGAMGVMTAAVAEAGGHVARLMGDGMLAFFGAPVAHEDDPLRAVRAGLRIQRGLGDYGKAVAERGGPAVQARVGINSGLVLAGQIGGEVYSEYTTTGDAVNLAARLEGAAPPGQVVLSQETARLVRGAVALEPFGPLQLKGKAEPVPAFLVTGPPPAVGVSVRGTHGVDTPLVGRAGERARLMQAFEDAIESRALGWITLTGDAGVGKSRLLATFLSDAAGSDIEADLARGRCVEQISDAYELVRSLLTDRYGIEAETGTEEAREQLTSGLAADLAGTARVDATRASRDLARLIFPEAETGEDPRGLAERAMAALAALVAAWAARKPLILALEDLHWADDSSLDALARMAEALAEAPAFILANARPVLFARRPHWGEGERGHVRLDLRPLSSAAVARLVRAILQDEDLPEPLLRFVSDRSEGNAYYIEELVGMLQDRGLLQRDESGWQLDLAGVEEGRVPTTLQGMLQARLDSLDPPARGLLQRASVLGRNFWTGALAAMGATDPDPLEALRAQGLVLARERSSIAGEREYVFKHALLRDAAYGSLLKRDRPGLHATAADWLAGRAGQHYAELAGQIARHAELAGRAAEAARHYQAAAERARTTYANAEAAALFQKAHDLWPSDDPAGRFDCLKGAEQALDMLGRRDEQRACLEQMSECAEALDDLARSHVHFRRSWLALRTGDPAAAEAEARQAFSLAGEDRTAQADALVNLGNALKNQKKNEAGLVAFQRALTCLEEIGDERAMARTLLGLATCHTNIGNGQEAREGYERALGIFKQLDDLGLQAKTLTNHAIAIAMRGDLDNAAPRFDEALALYRAAGDRVGEGIALHNLGYLAAEVDNLALAESRLRTALAIFRRVASTSDEQRVLTDLADVLRRAGREQEAESLTPTQP